MGTSWEMQRGRASSDTDRKKKGKKCGTSSEPVRGDRLTSLPDQILGHILSLLPTKDVAAMQVLSKRLGQAFSLITSIDLDDFPICHCICACPEKRTHLVERFPLFKSFVAKVLQKVFMSEFEGALTRFRLYLGGNRDNCRYFCSTVRCFPYLEPVLNNWISYLLSLAHTGLRELDLTFLISNHEEFNLPPSFFDCPSLQVLRLDANIRINSARIPIIYLPNANLIHIRSVFFTEVDFVSRLLSSCPALEDLSIKQCQWGEFNHATISSHSLRRLSLWWTQYDKMHRSNLLTFDTPNLQYFSLYDDLPHLYSVTHMNSLVEATLSNDDLYFVDIESGFRSQVSLLSAFTAVHHLLLERPCLETLILAAELEDRLPVFYNLKTLKLVAGSYGDWRWDVVLLFILPSLPVLETLVFTEGLFEYDFFIHNHPCPFPLPPPNDEEDYSEAEGWRTNTLPPCCLAHLKRIEFGLCFGLDRELNMIKFFLGKAPALKELVLRLFKDFDQEPGRPACKFPKPNFEEFLGKLEELPRASNSCSIIVHR